MFFNMNVRTRLAIIAFFSAAALLCVGIIGLVNGSKTTDEIGRVYYGGLTSIGDLLSLQEDMTNHFINPVQRLRDDTISWEQAKNSLVQLSKSLPNHWNSYVQSDPGLNDDLLANQKAILAEMGPQINRLQGIVDRSLTAIQEKDIQTLNAIAAKQLFPLVDPVLDGLHELVAIHQKDALLDFQDAQENAYWFQATTLISVILFLAILLPTTIAIIRTIVNPIEYASKAIATGDTNTAVQIMTGGELGKLLEAIQHMFGSLNKISGVLTAISNGDLTVEGSLRSEKDVLGNALHGMVTQTRFMIGEIKNEVNALATSSQEIMTSLSHISSGASETASAVTETTTTVEELKQTANISVDKAKDVLANAEDTLKTVNSTELSVMTTIEDMNQIRDRMQIVSDSILKLSEKSMVIAEIIDSVSDIAEQSNLLAVNAAIESAKAGGEYGRSFGVVAQEIRTLAEQSKSATVQVKALLGDIQSATSAAVLATEQGSKAVVKGVTQSTQTSKTIKDLVHKMAKVTQATNQIVLSNQQQLIGTEQITVAMTQINEATNQHVSHLKQIEEAVTKLNQVGGTLKGLTDRYHLNEDDRKVTPMKTIRQKQEDRSKELVESLR
ncbi:MAG: methyl-accepting chemotaxis protein [Chlamydiales bacterium]|nr:methyl-accepting chemotaxis protein [Chlamydiales bacterium]